MFIIEDGVPDMTLFSLVSSEYEICCFFCCRKEAYGITFSLLQQLLLMEVNLVRLGFERKPDSLFLSLVLNLRVW